MVLGQPIASDRFAPRDDLRHVAPQSRLVPSRPDLRTGTSLLVAGALRQGLPDPYWRQSNKMIRVQLSKRMDKRTIRSRPIGNY